MCDVKYASTLLMLAIGGVTANAWAADAEGVPVGPFRASGDVTASLKYDSNLFSRPAASSSLIETLGVGVGLKARKGPSEVVLGYDGEYGNVNDSSVDNYDDHEVSVSGQWKPASRHRFNARGFYSSKHDPRGSDDTRIQATPNEWHDKGIVGAYEFGSESSKGRFKLDAGYHDKNYTNNRVTTSALDLKQTRIGATFFWRVAPKTSVLVEARRSRDNYVTALRDSDLTDVLAGVTWTATGKTSGTLKLGYSKRDFDASTGLQDQSGAIWEGTVTWKPRSYSVFDLSLGRGIDNATAAGDAAITNSRIALAWRHKWDAHWNSKLNLGYTESDYANAANRLDKQVQYGASLDYLLNRRLTLSAGYQRTDKDTNAAGFEYLRDLVTLSARFGF